MGAKSRKPRFASAALFDYCDIVTIADTAGNDVLIAIQLNWRTSIFYKNIEMTPVENDLFFHDIPVCDDTAFSQSHIDTFFLMFL